MKTYRVTYRPIVRTGRKQPKRLRGKCEKTCRVRCRDVTEVLNWFWLNHQNSEIVSIKEE